MNAVRWALLFGACALHARHYKNPYLVKSDPNEPYRSPYFPREWELPPSGPALFEIEPEPTTPDSAPPTEWLPYWNDYRRAEYTEHFELLEQEGYTRDECRMRAIEYVLGLGVALDIPWTEERLTTFIEHFNGLEESGCLPPTCFRRAIDYVERLSRAGQL